MLNSIILASYRESVTNLDVQRLNHKDMNRRLIAKRVSDYADFVRIREERQKELEQLEKEYEDVCNKIAAIEER